MGVLKNGYFKTLYAEDAVFVYARYFENGNDVFGNKGDGTFAVCAVNRSFEQQTIKVDNVIRLLPSCNFETTRKVWSSSNTSVAVVDNRGNVTAVGEGKCTIKVTCYGEDSLGNEIKASASTKIVVNEKSEATDLKQKVREVFDEFFEVKLHDFLENLKKFMIVLLRYAY